MTKSCRATAWRYRIAPPAAHAPTASRSACTAPLNRAKRGGAKRASASAGCGRVSGWGGDFGGESKPKILIDLNTRL